MAYVREAVVTDQIDSYDMRSEVLWVESRDVEVTWHFNGDFWKRRAATIVSEERRVGIRQVQKQNRSIALTE